MNFSSIFIQRPVATTLLTMGLAFAGIVSYFLLPVAPLPNVDLPVIFVQASMPGASPETMSTSVATPLERHLGAIADVNEMTSSSTQNTTTIVLVFNLDRDIDGATRDVQAAINAAHADLPAGLKSNPTYRKINPADQPVLILALTSDTLTPGQIYDSASTILQQKLSQVQGIGQVQLGGSSLPAVRVDLNPRALFKYGIGLEDVRAALSAANADAPKGAIESGPRQYQVYVNDQASKAADYQNLIVAYRNNAAVRLQDVASVTDGVEDVRNLGMANGKPAILVILYRQPGANIIETVDNVKAALPALQAALPTSVQVIVANDRTGSIRAALDDVEITLCIAVLLVMFVVYLFLRSARAAFVPCVAVPLSLVGTFTAMYLFNFSLDNLSLMALTVATGFVVDDAIVVLENITRHIEAGMGRFEAALQGTKEVSFTVLAMSISLIAVFLPIILLADVGGMLAIVGRFFQEFSLTLATSIVISLIVSLTTTPMLCAHIDLHNVRGKQGWLLDFSERVFEGGKRFYASSLAWALRHSLIVLLTLPLTVAATVVLGVMVDKGLFPSEDTGEITGSIRGDQSISFQSMEGKFKQFVGIISKDPAVQTVAGFTGGGGGGPRGGGTNAGNVFIQLKSKSQRGGMTTDDVIQRLRTKMMSVAGARIFLQGAQDIRAGGRQSNAAYQYTLLGDQLSDLDTWVPKITDALQSVPQLEDVSSDREAGGLDVLLSIDRATAARLGISTSQIDNTLYDAFGQRQVSTIYNDLNQYHVVMGVAPQFWQNPDTLNDIYVSTSGGAVSGTQATGAVAGTTVITSTSAQTAAEVASDSLRNQQLNALTSSTRGGVSTGAAVSTSDEQMIPLAAVAHFGPGTTPLAVNHQGPFVAATFSFNLPPGVSLGQATDAIQRTMATLQVPVTLHGDFAGNAALFQQSLGNLLLLIIAAILAVYIVLGVLYESLIHPLTILSTLPSAGVGALLAMWVTGTELDVMGFIGIVLLIGIVKKNAIMMIDFALEAERKEGLSSRDAIYKACLLRFRPIMMTTFAAILGALPLAIGFGTGSELRQPLGISIVGGLLLSQLLTLYTTPVVYLHLDCFRLRTKRAWNRFYSRLLGDPMPEAAE
jgi:multidrug efflux pump